MTTMQGSGIRTFFLLMPDLGSEVTASEFILLCWLRGYSRECGASLLPAVGQELRFALAPFVGMVMRQSVHPCAWNGDPMLGGGAAAHSVDTCNQNDVLNRHLFVFSR
jgi:hypothetical protein